MTDSIPPYTPVDLPPFEPVEIPAWVPDDDLDYTGENGDGQEERIDPEIAG